jgi:hypothetical protein
MGSLNGSRLRREAVFVRLSNEVWQKPAGERRETASVSVVLGQTFTTKKAEVIMARATKRKLDGGDFPQGDQSSVSDVSDDKMRARIAERAYLLYEERGCVPGHDAEDWLEAERLVLDELNSKTKKPSRSPSRRKIQKAAD